MMNVLGHGDAGPAPPALSNDGRTVALASENEVTLHDALTGEVQRTLPWGRSCWLSFAGDGSLLVSSTRASVQRFARDGRPLENLQLEAGEVLLDASREGDRLLTAHDEGRRYRVRDARSGAVVASGSGAAEGLALARDGSAVAVSDEQGEISLVRLP